MEHSLGRGSLQDDPLGRVAEFGAKHECVRTTTETVARALDVIADNRGGAGRSSNVDALWELSASNLDSWIPDY